MGNAIYETWRSSDKCLRQAAAATQKAVAYSHQQSTTTATTQENVAHSQQQSTTAGDSLQMYCTQRAPLPAAQSIASSVIAKDVYSLRMKVDELELRLITLGKFSDPAFIKDD